MAVTAAATGAATGVATEVDARIGEYVDQRADEMISFLQTVVSTRSLWGDVPQLASMARILGERMARAGVAVTYPDSGTPGAPNRARLYGERRKHPLPALQWPLRRLPAVEVVELRSLQHADQGRQAVRTGLDGHERRDHRDGRRDHRAVGAGPAEERQGGAARGAQSFRGRRGDPPGPRCGIEGRSRDCLRADRSRHLLVPARHPLHAGPRERRVGAHDATPRWA